MRCEVTECCPWCESENTMIWNIELDGYVSYCPHCGKKMMLCDCCLHAEDNPTAHCNWGKDGDGGVCWRDNSPVELKTCHEGFSVKYFSVPRNWLIKLLGNKTIEQFVNNYSMNQSEIIYNAAKNDAVIIKED